MSGLKTDNPVVEVWFPIEKDAEGYPKSRELEALLYNPLKPDCSICTVASIPFYVQAVAFGDTITTISKTRGQLDFAEIVSRSGYSTSRILLRSLAQSDDVLKKLLDFGVMIERVGNLVAIAAPPSGDADALVDYILDGKKRGLWGAQHGYIPEGA